MVRALALVLPGRAVQRVVVDRRVQRERPTRRALPGVGLHRGEPSGKAGVRRSGEPHRGWIQRRAREPPCAAKAVAPTQSWRIVVVVLVVGAGAALGFAVLRVLLVLLVLVVRARLGWRGGAG